MKKSRFSEEQIIGVLREQEAGAKIAYLCLKHGMSSATFYAWKSKYGGMEVSDAKRLKALEEENTRLKKLYADAMLDNASLKVLPRQKWFCTGNQPGLAVHHRPRQADTECLCGKFPGSHAGRMPE